MTPARSARTSTVKIHSGPKQTNSNTILFLTINKQQDCTIYFMPPKDPEKFEEWLSHQTQKCQRKWRKRGIQIFVGRPQPKGEESKNWKGDQISYKTAHIWVQKIKPKPTHCPKCGAESKIELCNINGVYNRDPENYQWLCTKCHRAFDGFSYKRMRQRANQFFFNQYYQANISMFGCAE